MRGHQLLEAPGQFADLVVVVDVGERGQVGQRRLQPLPVLGRRVRLGHLEWRMIFIGTEDDKSCLLVWCSFSSN